MTAVSRSVIVPVFNGRRHLPLFWESLNRCVSGDTELIVVDDGSDEPVRRYLQRSRCCRVAHLRHERARGFAAAVNAGIEHAVGSDIYILNSDLILEPESLDELATAIHTDRRVGVAAAKLLYPQTGTIQHAGIGFTQTNHHHLFRHAPKHHELVSRNRAVQAVAFALCALRRDVLEAVGKLNDAYINGYEDLEYCFRLRDVGYNVILHTGSVALHWERQSGSARSVLRKDNVARLWGEWGSRIQADMRTYFAEALAYILERHPELRDDKFTVVNLSRGAAGPDIADFLSSAGTISIDDCWDLNQRGTSDYALWLPLLLPVDAARHPRPFVYIVDEIPQLDENHYWLALRRLAVEAELAIDHNANIVALRGEVA
jgi:GT2 family glycosyltransferase